jgi:hypothetical protein
LLADEPLMLRTAAVAEESAAFWACVLATATMPMSMARATSPIRAIKQTATRGSTTPRRTWRELLRIIIAYSPWG